MNDIDPWAPEWACAPLVRQSRVCPHCNADLGEPVDICIYDDGDGRFDVEEFYVCPACGQHCRDWRW